MLIKDLYKIEQSLQELANNLAQKLSNPKINVSIDEYNNNFYFVDRLNYANYFRSGSTYFYRQKGYFNYGLFSEYYYNCSKDNIVRYIKNKYYHIYNYHTLINTISDNIANKKDGEKIYIILDERLFEYLIKELRKKIKSSINLNTDLSYLFNLYPIYSKLLNKFVFYISFREYEIFNLFYKDFTFCIGFDIDIYVKDKEINVAKFLNKQKNFILKHVKKLFNQNLNNAKLLFMETNYGKINVYKIFSFVLVFKMYNIKEIIQVSILNDLCKFI